MVAGGILRRRDFRLVCSRPTSYIPYLTFLALLSSPFPLTMPISRSQNHEPQMKYTRLTYDVKGRSNTRLHLRIPLRRRSNILPQTRSRTFGICEEFGRGGGAGQGDGFRGGEVLDFSFFFSSSSSSSVIDDSDGDGDGDGDSYRWM